MEVSLLFDGGRKSFVQLVALDVMLEVVRIGLGVLVTKAARRCGPTRLSVVHALVHIFTKLTMIDGGIFLARAIEALS